MKKELSIILIFGVLFVLFVITIGACGKSSNSNTTTKKARIPPTETHPDKLRVIPTNSGKAPVNTVCQALLHGYRNFSSFNERENFTPAYKQEVASTGCSWKPFEDVRCENMPSQDGIRQGCDPEYYKNRCGVYQDYVRLISGSDVEPFIYPIERLIKGECDSDFNPYV